MDPRFGPDTQRHSPRATSPVDPTLVIPTIDIAALLRPSDDGGDERRATGEQLVAACEGPGVFRIVGHGLDPALRRDLEAAARTFFELDDDEKSRIEMHRTGPAWRGWFPVGGELTAGVADRKEGLYFGIGHTPDDARVLAGVPLHGPNQFPERPSELGRLVRAWMASVTALGQAVLSGIALGMGLDADWFRSWCADPTVLFRIFRYPSLGPAAGTRAALVTTSGERHLGVGEHTDYGLLTLLTQDGTGGLQVKVDGAWLDVDADPDAIVCNLGDMLELLSGGRFVATPHRVTTPSRDRISMPLFLDPGWDVRVGPLPGADMSRASAAGQRWDGEDLRFVDGPYSEYLLSRVAKVFPGLYEDVIAGGASGPEGHPGV